MLNRLLICFSAILLLTGFTHSVTDKKPDELKKFIQLADSCGLKFELPKGFHTVPVIENNDLWYDFALKSDKHDFEVRYTIWPLKQDLEAYKKCLADTSCVMIHPNQFYKGRIVTNILNMTGGEMSDIGPFPTEAVTREFHADAGGSAFYLFNCGFGKGYQYGQMVYLHKDDVADVIITYLSNDTDTHSELMGKAFHCLTFR